MNFAHPAALAWLLLAIPIVLLYLRRETVRREPTAMAMFWEQVFAGVKESWLRRNVRWISLGVQLVLLVLLTTAMAEPRLSRPQNVAIVVDNAGDCAAARHAAARLVEEMGEGDLVSIFSTAPIAAHCGATGDKAAALKAIEAIEAGGARGRLEDLKAVLATAGRGQWTRMVVVGGAGFAGADGAFEAVPLDERGVAAEAPPLLKAPWRAMWWLFAALAAVLLAVEWPFYHRHRIV